MKAVPLNELVDLVEERITINPATTYTFLRIGYNGEATRGEQRLGGEISYPFVGRARPGDIVVSNINAVHGATCVLPDDLGHVLTTSEFTVLRVKPGVKADPMYLWSVLRSAAVRAEWLSASTGLGRHRVGWDLLSNQKVPLLDETRQREIGDLHRAAIRLAHESQEMSERALGALAPLKLDAEAARERMIRAKPPK